MDEQKQHREAAGQTERTALASESKQSVESRTAAEDGRAKTTPRDMDACERTTAASNRTDGEDSGDEREQTVENQAADVDEQATAAINRTDGEDSGGEREQAMSRQPSSKQQDRLTAVARDSDQ